MNNSMLLFLSFVTLLSCAGASVGSRKLLWGNDITTEAGHPLGRLEIFEGEEAINVVDAFVQNIADDVDLGNAIGFRSNLLDVVCESESITCSTRVPLVYRKLINDEHGKNLGAIEVYENEELIDAVVRFLRQTKVSVDEIALKNYVFEQACGLARVLCTRNVAVVYNQMINESDGSPIDRLVIYENEEPADKAFKWCKENNVVKYYDCEYDLLLLPFVNKPISFTHSYSPLPPGGRAVLVNSVCESDMVICKRRQPVYLSISISDPDGGHINMLELKHGNEPADDVFAFFATNGLFKKKWDFHGMVQQICAKPSVDCKREKAVKYFDNNFSMGNKELGRLVIWEDEEVVDVLYNIRMHHNMTAQDQRISFNDICKRPEVPCNRFKAIAYRKTQITKLDYEKFGNETCRRQFVGVKHLASFGELPFGGKISKMLKKDGVVSVSLLWMLAIVMANVSVVLFTKTLIIPRCVCW